MSYAHDIVIVRMLLDAKADISGDTWNMSSVMRCACEKLRPDTVKALIDADMAIVDGNLARNSMIQITMRVNCTNTNEFNTKTTLLNLLFDAVAPTLREERLIALFHEAIYCEPNHDHFVTMKVMLERYPGLIHSRGYYGRMPLMSLVKNCRCPVKDFKSLIDYGLYVDGEDDSGQSVLEYVLAQYYPTETHKHEIFSLVLNSTYDLDQLHMSLLYLVYARDYSESISYMLEIFDHILRLPIDATGGQDLDSANADLRNADIGVASSSKRQKRW
jgi:hypothetical protein